MDDKGDVEGMEFHPLIFTEFITDFNFTTKCSYFFFPLGAPQFIMRLFLFIYENTYKKKIISRFFKRYFWITCYY